MLPEWVPGDIFPFLAVKNVVKFSVTKLLSLFFLEKIDREFATKKTTTLLLPKFQKFTTLSFSERRKHTNSFSEAPPP